MFDNLPFSVPSVHHGGVKRVSASVSIPARTPGRVDRRFIIGVALIIASVIAFSALSGLLRGGSRVYSVTSSIAPGEAITADNVKEVVVRVDPAVYAPTTEAPLGTRATRPLTPGQLVMRSDLATQGQTRSQDADGIVRVAITVNAGLPDAVADGTPIRLWSVPTRSNATPDPKAREIEGTFTFVRSVEHTASAAHRGTRIEIMANTEALPTLLAAQASTDGLAAVPVGAP